MRGQNHLKRYSMETDNKFNSSVNWINIPAELEGLLAPLLAELGTNIHQNNSFYVTH